MTYMLISPPVLSQGWTHDATDYQIATDALFTDESIVLESMGDSENKLVKIFTEDLDPNLTYYGRARVIFNKAIGEWTDVQIVHARDVDTLNLSLDIPGLIKTPRVTIDYPVDNVPGTLFTITTDIFSCNSNCTHAYTNYLIKDQNGKTVWANLKDRDNLTSLFFNNSVLEDGYTYLLEVSYGSSCNDVSEAGRLLFTVPLVKDIRVLSQTIGLDKSENLLLKLEPIESVVEVTYTLYEYVYRKDMIELYTVVSNIFTNEIDKSHFEGNQNYFIMKVTYKYQSGRKESKFIPLIFNKIG